MKRGRREVCIKASLHLSKFLLFFFSPSKKGCCRYVVYVLRSTALQFFFAFSSFDVAIVVYVYIIIITFFFFFSYK